MGVVRYWHCVDGPLTAAGTGARAERQLDTDMDIDEDPAVAAAAAAGVILRRRLVGGSRDSRSCSRSETALRQRSRVVRRSSVGSSLGLLRSLTRAVIRSRKVRAVRELMTRRR